MTPNIAFFGTSHISTLVLDVLLREGLTPKLIITAPDRPKGRKLELTPPPVKVWAEQHQVPVIQPEQLDHIPSELTETSWDLFVVVSYGVILKKELLDIPLHGTLNVHPSLLPAFRGPAPIQAAILNDQRETGVTVMLLDEQMDHGPIIAQAQVTPEEWPLPYSVLEELLGSVGGELLAQSVLPWINGDIIPEEQNHEKASYVKKLSKEDGHLDLDDDPYENFLKICAFEGWPGTSFTTTCKGEEVRVKIAEAEYANKTLHIKKVIPPGKQVMDYEDFKRGCA